MQLLKKHTGLAFVEWVTAQCMERAKNVGFADEAYVTRRLTQRFVQSPSQYRRQMRVEAEQV
ncbi:hypothetical protein [Caballeronia sp. Lep1P3]|uniref:hypothetical protein n=1 Tax=Caballeronia sp. Lep1P3 TaxID=2878150 RepID=UPI001FD48003|nr:hypothetical protein [Caballeronia sp. Lep1P3]